MSRRLRSAEFASLTVVFAGVVASGFRRLRRWGASADECAYALPGDELSPSAAVVHTRAITINAPATMVWPWLMQIGQDRSGFFSYTVLENLVGCQMPRVHELREEWSHRWVGDRVWMASPTRFRGGAYNVVARCDKTHDLVLVAPIDPELILRGGESRWTWQFVLISSEHTESTRLIVRSRYLRPQLWLEPIHFVMERKMMKTIARLAESEANCDKGIADGTSGTKAPTRQGANVLQ